MQPSWTSDTRQFTRQYYKWLEDINRYEAENGHVSITVNDLKGNIAENLMMRINQTTTFDNVHQWISNYFNCTYTGTEDNHEGQVGGVSNYDNENDNEEEYDEGWDYDDNDPVTIAFFRGKAKGQKKVHQINDNEYYYEDESYTWDNSWNKDWQLPDDNRQWGAQEVGQVLQQHPSEDNSASTLPIVRSLYEIGSLTAQGYNGHIVGYNGENKSYIGSNGWRLDRFSPRHLKDFWSIIIDTGAAVSVCPMTFCEHMEVTTMPESARRQLVTIRFIVSNVQSALLGLLDIDENNVSVHTGKHPYLKKSGKFEQLHRHGANLHAAAI
eukprot:3279345-Amphidinium_carterae.1